MLASDGDPPPLRGTVPTFFKDRSMSAAAYEPSRLLRATSRIVLDRRLDGALRYDLLPAD